MTGFFGKLFNKSSGKWVLIGSNDSITDYYDPASVNIVDYLSCFEVNCIRVYTTKGKQILFEDLRALNISKDAINDIHHSINSYIIYYERMKKVQVMTLFVSESGQLLLKVGSDSPPQETDITPGTVDDMILKKLLKDYSINR